MNAVAPAKAILSGEHAVVYGAPALAVAVKRHAVCRVTRGNAPELVLELPDLGQSRRLPPSELASINAACRRRHAEFVAGASDITTILPAPGDLLLCALAGLLAETDHDRLAGLTLRLETEIPVGGGMGSSAATVAALLRAVAATLQRPLAPAELLAHTRAAEELQHGRSSGIDPAICCAGGAIRYQAGSIEPLSLALDAHWYLANSGRPEASTGVCCDVVRRRFGQSTIWREFEEVTTDLERALSRGEQDAIRSALRENHRLLCAIGVVPEPVRDWIASVERSGGAAKVSGAGSVTGAGAGMLLVYHPHVPDKIRNGMFKLTPMEIDPHGATIRD